jgi:protein-disulfide isomerase
MSSSATRRSSTARALRRKSNSSLSLWLIGAGLFFVALIALVIFANTRRTTITPTALDLPAEWINRTALGDPSAPVVLQIWEDFLCPYCADWNAQIKPQVLDTYIKPGIARLEFRQFPLPSHAPGSLLGAQASECAADQNAFWPYHDALFSAGRTQGQAGFTEASLRRLAGDLGLDESELGACLSNQRHSAAIQASLQEATQLGLNSTPSLLINGKLISNPFDLATIEAELQQITGG